MGVQSKNGLPKLESRERGYAEHFLFGISVENLYRDGLFTKYDVRLLRLWNMYHYYDYDYELLPRAKDGGLNYGLISSMRAIDDYHRAGKEQGQPQQEDGNNNEDPPLEV